MKAFGDSANRPYLHLVDGGVSDNLGMRDVLDALEIMQALHLPGRPTPLDNVHRIVVFVVNSLSTPPDELGQVGGTTRAGRQCSKAAGTPIDHYSYESVELLKDMAAEWTPDAVPRKSAALSSNTDPAVAGALRTSPRQRSTPSTSRSPSSTDKAEFDYLNEPPTSFVLPAEAVDRLRAAAGKIILTSPEFNGCSRTRRDNRSVGAPWRSRGASGACLA